eukprot:4357128-Amphidinium_carterae.1
MGSLAAAYVAGVERKDPQRAVHRKNPGQIFTEHEAARMCASLRLPTVTSSSKKLARASGLFKQARVVDRGDHAQKGTSWHTEKLSGLSLHFLYGQLRH